jgi:hypothetical protein
MYLPVKRHSGNHHTCDTADDKIGYEPQHI